jgi:hypothetical protein
MAPSRGISQAENGPYREASSRSTASGRNPRTARYTPSEKPRVLPVVGMIGAPLLLVGTAAVLFGVVGRTSLLPVVLGIPIALWESPTGTSTTAAPAAAR